MLAILIEEYFLDQYEGSNAIFFFLINPISARVFAGGSMGKKDVPPPITSILIALST